LGLETKGKSLKGEAVPAGAWLLGLAAWSVPGAGHLLQARWWRGLILGGAVWAMFLIGLVFDGHLYDLFGSAEGGWSGWLQRIPAIANVGSGLLYLVCWAADIGFAENAKAATFEYGNTFLLVAGLVNSLAMLDAFDIAVGRKP
jgi:hypothetical protein